MKKSKNKFSIKNGFKPFYINNWKFKVSVILMLIISISVLDFLEEKNFNENYTYISLFVFIISLISLPFTGLMKNFISFTGKIETSRLDSMLGYEDKKAKSFLFDVMIFAADLMIFLFGVTALVFLIIALIFF